MVHLGHPPKFNGRQKELPRVLEQPYMVDMELSLIFYHKGGQKTMTNEELAVMIQSGERDKPLELWEQVRRFVRDRAYKWTVAVGTAAGVTVEDLTQAGYLAMMGAVERFDPAAGYAFNTILGNCLKTEFSIATGVRTKRQQMDPLRSAASLDVPVGEEEGGGLLGDFIEDPQAVQCFEDVETQPLHDAVEKALQSLTEEQRAVIRCMYYQGLTLEQTSQVLDMDRTEVRTAESKALRTLRHPNNSRELRQYMRVQESRPAGRLSSLIDLRFSGWA